jgi:hypothetical protein
MMDAPSELARDIAAAIDIIGRDPGKASAMPAMLPSEALVSVLEMFKNCADDSLFAAIHYDLVMATLDLPTGKLHGFLDAAFHEGEARGHGFDYACWLVHCANIGIHQLARLNRRAMERQIVGYQAVCDYQSRLTKAPNASVTSDWLH